MHGFGNFIVCSSPEIAKEIALGPDRRLQCRCVTYDGDIYDSGTLTGGSDGNFQYILPKYRELRVV
jgi:chromosome segregation ATPase